MEGLTPLELEAILARSFVSGRGNEDRLRVRYFSRDADGALVAHVRFGPGAEGPPRHAHGGSIAAAMDEAMGMAAWLAGHKVVAVRLSVDFRKLVPLGTEATLVARVSAVDGRVVTTTATLEGPNGELHATGEGTFLEVPETFERLAR